MWTMLVRLDDLAHWAVAADDALRFEVASLPGCAIVNPALYPAIVKVHDLETELIAKATFIDKGVYYFASNVLFIEANEALGAAKWEAETSLEWERKISTFISHLRFASKQVALKPKLKSFGPWNPPGFPPLKLPEKGGNCATSSWHLRTAVSGEHIVRAGRQPDDSCPPSYSKFLLDAIDSLVHGDYATAFVLAAISMDHLSRAMTADAFVAAIQGDTQGSLVLAFPPTTTPESRSERTEELSKLLLRNRPFKELLHSVPLALTGRSLFRENKGLYDKALRVYELRNRVVHKDVAFKAEFLPRFFGSDEAIESVRCAVQLAAWFGADSNYAYPFDGPQMTTCSLPKA